MSWPYAEELKHLINECWQDGKVGEQQIGAEVSEISSIFRVTKGEDFCHQKGVLEWSC